MGRKRYHNPTSQPQAGEYVDAPTNLPADPGGRFHGQGRGAGLNPGNRFETTRLHVLGEHLDHLDHLAQDEPMGNKLATQVLPDKSQSVINRVTSPDIAFSWSLNPYRGCEHGCLYCYARPFHEMLGYSAGLDFETKLIAKYDAPKLLRRELSKPSWHGEPIGMGSATDCYQPIEKELRLTRGCLQVAAQCHQPIHITTKSRLILRDLDLLTQLAQHQAIHVAISLTSIDPHLSAQLEPRASSPAHRLHAIEQLTRAGVPVVVLVAPIVPGLTDQQIPSILQAAHDAGARSAGYELLRLPGQVEAIFLDWLQRQFPQRAKHIESLIRQTHHGLTNEPGFFVRFRGHGPIAQQISRLFKLFRHRYQLDRPLPALNRQAFQRPHSNPHQASLFD